MNRAVNELQLEILKRGIGALSISPINGRVLCSCYYQGVPHYGSGTMLDEALREMFANVDVAIAAWLKLGSGAV